MKKTAYIILAAALLAAACKPEKPVTSPTLEKMTLTVRFDAPQSRISFAGEADGKTKTAWSAEDKLWVRSDTQPAWERGDCFTTSAEAISADGHTATFTGVSRKDGLLAVAYPYERIADGADNDAVCFDMPKTCPLVPGNAPALTHAAVGFLRDGSTQLAMKFVLGALKVGITGSGESIGMVELADADEGNALWGTLVVTPDYTTGDAASIRMENPAAGRNSVQLSAEGVKLSSTPVEFYFMLPEGSLAKGLTLKVFSADGEVMKQFTTTSSANAIARGKVVKLPAVDYTSAPVLSDFSGGTGTEGDPYLIKKKADLTELSEKVNAEASHDKYADKHYRLAADIDMAGSAFLPIGNSAATAFKGHFDGKGREIANLSADGESSANPASGLFGYAEGATLKDIVLKNRTNAGTFGYVGGLVGSATGCQISGCSILGGELKSESSYAGGIAAYINGGSLTGCTVSGLKIQLAGNHVGGLVGEFFDGTLTGCTVTGGSVVGGKQNVGGLVGWFDKGTLKDCLLTGKSSVVGTGDGVGGFVGRAIAKGGARNLFDKCCVNDATVQGAYSVGGMIGYAYPDANGPVELYNCGIFGATLRATACDTGGDPAKGDSMIAGICGWPRLADNASTFTAVNCFLHFAPGGLICDLPMKNVSGAGFTGYVSISAAGSLTIQNCVTNLGAEDMVVGGAPVTSSSVRYGALFAHTPDGRNADISHNYCVTGLPMYGVKGNSVVCNDNEAVAPGELASIRSKLNAFAAAYTAYPLSSWKMDGLLPVLE